MVTGMGAAFQIRKGEKEVLGPRRGAGLWPPGGGAKSPEGDGPYAYPAGGYFSSQKSNPPAGGGGGEQRGGYGRKRW